MQAKVSGAGASRFCPQCDTEVQDVGGFCLLGHSLRLTASTKSLGELRNEVAATFAHATGEVVDAFSGSEPESPPAAPAGPPPAAPIDPMVPPSPPSRPAPPTPPGAPPPPPPPAAPADPNRPPGDFLERSATIWRTLEQDVPPPESDPIAAFAPPPRMDWGPSRPGLRRPASFKRLKSQDAATA